MKKIKHIILLIAIALLSSGCIGVNREFKNIRSQILDNLNDNFDKQIEFSVGPVGFFIASQFVKFADSEENIDQMLSQVENIHVGVYERTTTDYKPSLSLLNTIANSIVDDDWKSLVKTIDGNEMVSVFVKDMDSDDVEELFVVALTDEELVMVKLKGSLGSIIEVVIREQGHNLKFEKHS